MQHVRLALTVFAKSSTVPLRFLCQKPAWSRAFMAALAPSKPTSCSRSPRIPERLKVLYVTTLHRTGAWLSEAFATDSASQVVLSETVGATAGFALLREEVFDVIVVSHEPGALDALDFVEGLRTGGHDEPMIVLGSEDPQAFEALAYEVGADAYCCMSQTTTRSLLWEFARAIRRYELVTENRRLVEADRQRLASEHAEAERLLGEQRTLLEELEAIEAGKLGDPDENVTTQDLLAAKPQGEHGASLRALPAALVGHYRDLLQTYVVMGSGNLNDEMSRLAEVLIKARVSAQQAMHLHVEVLEGMIDGLGRRSARHVMNRADLLVLEVMIHLADGYRRLEEERSGTDQQLLLPGFDAADVFSGRCEFRVN